jgi:hypothetical protein
MRDYEKLSRTHDLRLPDWGPYTKKYAGISHLPDVQSGLRFDLTVFPGYYRRALLVPNSKWESGYHPWEAAPDLSYYAYRFELEWKDRVYCDVSYSADGEHARLVRSEFVNHTAEPQNLVLQYAAYMNFPPVRTYSDEPVQLSRAVLPEKAVWLDALDYDDMGFATQRPQDNLVYDGLWRGEVRGHGFVNGAGLGTGFGREAGDWVRYTFHLTAPVKSAVLLARYRALEGEATCIVSGLQGSELVLPASADFALASVPAGDLAGEDVCVELVSKGRAAFDLDGLVLVSQAQADEVQFKPVEWQHVPQILPGPLPNSLMLKYADAPVWYGLAWTGEPWVQRELFTDELDRMMRYYVHEHVQKVLRGNGEGHFSNVFIRPVEVPSGQSRVLYGLACDGTRQEVEHRLASFSGDPQQLEAVYLRARTGVAKLEPAPAGDGYRFSQEHMAANTLLNVSYPVYTRRTFIRHNAPGKWWDCLYTWDSGFIGLGLLEVDVERAIDCLNAYTTPPGDPQVAFMHHGSMVPTQHYLFLELWNRTQDRELLEYFYPRMRQYYQFFAGKLGSSTTGKLKSRLLKTWDYFYNSGGWDDYPPQVYVHANRLESSVSPVVSSAQGIRLAKILQMAARAVGQPGDVDGYQADIDTWTESLNRYAWDAEAGFFGYVRHDEQGSPVEILRHESGQNYNMGIDGAAPYYSGICTPEQEALIYERLASPQRMWTPTGICSVDKTAAYYKLDGYWNGAVWFPHQWFYWKALLDNRRSDFAAQLARTALDTWKGEVDTSYHCFEHFIVQSGRGAGWHQFSGLSCPVLGWYGAYHRPGRLTTGFDTWVQRQEFSQGNRRLEAELIQPHAALALVTMAPQGSYQASWNGQTVSFVERYPGVLEIELPGAPEAGSLVVESKE